MSLQRSLKALFLAIPFSMVATLSALSSPDAMALTDDFATQEQLKQLLEDGKDVKTASLPLTRVIVSEKNGKTIFMSENGRYRFGEITDTWNKIAISSYEDVVFSKDHVPLDNIRFDTVRLNAIKFGNNGQQRVVAYVAPEDPVSRKFINEMQSLRDEFSFDLIVIPGSRNTTRNLALSYSCISDEIAAREALLTGIGLEELKPQEDCVPELLTNRLISFRMLGLTKLPAIIAPSSKVSVGDRADGWTNFLMENMK